MTGDSATPQEQAHIPTHGGTNSGSHDKDIYLRPAEQAAREAQIRARAQHRAMEMLDVLRFIATIPERDGVGSMHDAYAGGELSRKLVEEIEAP